MKLNWPPEHTVKHKIDEKLEKDECIEIPLYSNKKSKNQKEHSDREY